MVRVPPISNQTLEEILGSRVSNEGVSRVISREISDEGNPYVFAHGNVNKPFVEQRYFERALLLADEKDTVLMRDYDNSYATFLEERGFQIPQICVLANDTPRKSLLQEIIHGDHFVDYKGHDVSFFSGVDIKKQVAEAMKARYLGPQDPMILNKYVDKSEYKDVCRELGIPVVEGEVYEMSGNLQKDREALENILTSMTSDGNNLIMRATSGSGCNYEVSRDNVETVLTDIFETEGASKQGFLIDPKVDVVSSPNVTFYANSDGKIFFVGRSNQVLSDLKYEGNDFDFERETQRDEILDYSIKLARHIADHNYVGFFGLDFMETSRGEIYGCEVNLRINGSNYVRSGIERMEQITNEPVGYARAKVLDLPQGVTKFEDFVEHSRDLLFDGKTSRGILPYGTSQIRDGKINAVITGENKEEVDRIDQAYSIRG